MNCHVLNKPILWRYFIDIWKITLKTLVRNVGSLKNQTSSIISNKETYVGVHSPQMAHSVGVHIPQRANSVAVRTFRVTGLVSH